MHDIYGVHCWWCHLLCLLLLLLLLMVVVVVGVLAVVVLLQYEADLLLYRLKLATDAANQEVVDRNTTTAASSRLALVFRWVGHRARCCVFSFLGAQLRRLLCSLSVALQIPFKQLR